MLRFLEIVPGGLTWLTFVLMVALSWYAPAFVAVFIILFDIYWLLKTLYLSLHLRAAFVTMRKNMKINWQERLRELKRGALSAPLSALHETRPASSDWQSLYHLILFPMATEPYAVVRESFETLCRANYPNDKFIVVLGIEERAGEAARKTALAIEREFGNRFFKFLVTAHPADLPGEIPGKGSNEAWAAARAKETIIDPLGLDYDRILVSVFDVDTQIFPEYFGILTYTFLTVPDPLHAAYQPVPFFTNNIFEAPALARVVSFSTTFWQMMQQSRPERLTTFSSQSIPFRALVEIGFWHKNVVSEDSHIFWQCYLHYHGSFRVEPLHYPLSMDANAAPSFWRTMKNLYKQQRRWAWGVENVPYLLHGLARDKKILRRKKWYWGFNTVEGYHSWATNSLMIFALGWLPLLMGGRTFGYTLLSYSLPRLAGFFINLSMIGIVSSAILSLVILPDKPAWFRPHHYIWYFVQWALMPMTLIIFGAIPAIEAQTRLLIGGRARLGFWITPKQRRNLEPGRD